MFLRFPARRQGMREKVLPISACSRRSRNDKAIVEKPLERPLHGSWRLSERRGKLLNPLCIDLVKKSAQRDLRSRESGRARRDLTGSLHQSVCIEDPGRHACDGGERLGLVVERPAEHDAAQRDLWRDPAGRLRRRGRGPQPPRRLSGRGSSRRERPAGGGHRPVLEVRDPRDTWRYLGGGRLSPGTAPSTCGCLPTPARLRRAGRPGRYLAILGAAPFRAVSPIPSIGLPPALLRHLLRHGMS